eukprot:s2771_g5.t1
MGQEWSLTEACLNSEAHTVVTKPEDERAAVTLPIDIEEKVDKSPKVSRRRPNNPTLLIGGEGEDNRSLRKRSPQRNRTKTADPELIIISMAMSFT